ncbi:uncharacterized protein [Nicotiana sylvestris]|uniref:uncharacterized protein n=1 Tax=Nicotiana sylvestris TaxID=4096 RepID=UPI00388CDCFC
MAEVKEKQFNDPLLAQPKEGIHKHKTTAFSLCMDDGTLWYQGRLCVLDIDGLRGRITTEVHNSRVVADFVARCPNCQQVKSKHQRPGELAQSIEIPMWKWEMINMDFVVGLPRTLRKFDSIWVIVDRLTKSAYFLPIRSTDTVERYAQLYIKEILRLHETPFSIISYRGAQFTANFWKKFQQGLGKQVVGDASTIVPIESVEVNEELSYEEIPVAILDRWIGPVTRETLPKFLKILVVGYATLIVLVDTIEVNEELTYEEILVAILDRQVQKLRNKEIASVKVLWRNKQVEETTWKLWKR